ncbi:hypothetical protein lerEdw1_016419 [Lerista edwardsae]|nr:hypothetical protein lerEdw1_016419 [Lerista edwardsae]
MHVPTHISSTRVAEQRWVHNVMMKIKTNYFIVSLAFADLLVSILVMPFGAIELVQDNWIYGDTFCLVRTSLDVQLTTASILHLCCISLDRVKTLCVLRKCGTVCPLCKAETMGASLVQHSPVGVSSNRRENSLGLAQKICSALWLVQSGLPPAAVIKYDIPPTTEA